MIMSTTDIVKEYVNTPRTDLKDKISILADKNLVSEQDMVDLLRNNRCTVPSGSYKTTVGSHRSIFVEGISATPSASDTERIRILEFTVKQLLAELEHYRPHTKKDLYPANIVKSFDGENDKDGLDAISRGIRWICFPCTNMEGKVRPCGGEYKKKKYCITADTMSNAQYAKYLEIFSKVTEIIKDYKYKEEQ